MAAFPPPRHLRDFLRAVFDDRSVPVTDKEMALNAQECQELARLLGDRQNSESTLTPRLATRLVNALLNAGNTFAFLLREKHKETNDGPANPDTPVPGPA